MEVEKNYETITTLGAKPKERSTLSATQILKDNKMIILGGEDSGDEKLDDTHELDLSTMTWRPVAVHGTNPNARQCHAACLSPDQSQVLM